MNVILEGCDGTFKTTMANKLSEALGMKVIQGSSFESAKMTYDELLNWYIKLFTGAKNIIFDRSMYSNKVYATLYKGYTLLNDSDIKSLENLIKSEGDCLVILCTGYPADIASRINTRGDKYVDPKDVNRILDFYDNMYGKINLQCITYNSSLTDLDYFVNLIAEHVKYRRGREDNGNTATDQLC